MKDRTLFKMKMSLVFSSTATLPRIRIRSGFQSVEIHPARQIACMEYRGMTAGILALIHQCSHPVNQRSHGISYA